MEEGPKPKGQEIQYGQGTVLLVDDDNMIIQVGKKMLETLGYEVLTARNGQEALGCLRRGIVKGL
ncbi:MAG: response regulator [Desulfobacteraceae bacterium]